MSVDPHPSHRHLPSKTVPPRLRGQRDHEADGARPGSAGDVNGQAGGNAPPRLLGFYDRLRHRILARVGRQGAKLSRTTVEALLLVPDVFFLLLRLSLDREVPKSVRSLTGGALVYFLVPFDLLPEALVGSGGYLDDLVLAAAVLAQAFGDEAAPYVDRHWNGRREWRGAIRDLCQSATALLGDNLYLRLQRLLAKRGVKLAADDQGKTSGTA